MIWIFITLIPTLYEAYSDRFGESKKNKLLDTLWLVVVALTIAGVAWWLGQRPLPVIGLMLIWRVTTFDYIVHAFLKRYSEGHKKINIWKFSGTTAFWDRIASRIPPMWRLLIRACLLVASLWLYLAY
jgi:hypothetical protein